VPELKGMTLVLSYDVLAGIYLGQVSMWNDDSIKAINTPEVAAALPDQPIIVITQSVVSAVMQAFTTVLNNTVPAFAAQVLTPPPPSPGGGQEKY
jgi:ABC-type phosphate transport system substrate-binding protein